MSVSSDFLLAVTIISYQTYLSTILGGIALVAQAILPISPQRGLSVCLSHSCTLLKPFDGFRWHSAGTLVGSNDTSCQMGVPDSPGKGGDSGSNPCQNMQIKSHSATWRTDEEHGWTPRFRVLPNYFVSCFVFFYSWRHQLFSEPASLWSSPRAWRHHGHVQCDVQWKLGAGCEMLQLGHTTQLHNNNNEARWGPGQRYDGNYWAADDCSFSGFARFSDRLRYLLHWAVDSSADQRY